MDYDPLAAEYAAHRDPDPALVDALRRGSGVTSASRVLEVGCGTGNYIGALRDATRAECFGVDPSREMLAVARARSSGVEFLSGIAEALPVPAGSFDLVFCVDVIHHFGDLHSAVVEAARALRGGGRLCVVTEDADMIRNRIHARYFPETVEVDLARYPSLETLRDAIDDADLADVSEQRLASPRRVTDLAAYRAKAFSSMHSISNEAFARGLERMHRDLEGGPIEGETRHVLFWATAP